MEIIPKEKPLKSYKSFNVLFYFSLCFLFFSIAGFFVLNHFLGEMRKEHVRLESILIQKVPPEKLALEREVLNYQKKIDNFLFLMDQRLNTSRFFAAFEKIINPQIQLSNFNLNPTEGIVTFSGYVQDVQILEQQIFVIRDTDWIKDFKLERALMTEEREVDFSLTIFFDPKILK